jgi:hypothetical protein
VEHVLFLEYAIDLTQDFGSYLLANGHVGNPPHAVNNFRKCPRTGLILICNIISSSLSTISTNISFL